MGNPKLWFTPVSGGSVEEIDFVDGAWVSQWQDNMIRDASDSESISGLSAHTARGTALELALSCERFTDRVIAHKLMSFQHHVEIGGLFGFANDSDRAYAAWTTTTPARGDTVLTMGPGSYWNAGASLAAGLYLCVESALPTGAREWVRIQTAAISAPGGTITLAEPLVYDHTAPCLVRIEHYHPSLRWPVKSRRTLVTSDRQMVWSFNGTFREDRGSLFEDQGQGQGFQPITAGQPAPRRPDDVWVSGN